MPIVRFDSKLANFVIHGDRRYFFILIDNCPFFIQDNCPHRGGPIHLGYLNCKKDAIMCPWHNSAVSLQRLQSLAVPSIWRRNELLTVVLPESNSAQIILKHRQTMVAAEDKNCPQKK